MTRMMDNHVGYLVLLPVYTVSIAALKYKGGNKLDIGRAFGFITEDESWISKILIGGLLQIIPIVGLIALLGYTFEVARNVAQGRPRPLPDWSNFGDKLVKGLYGLVISLVYAIPIAILIFILFFVIALAGAASGDSDAAGGVVALLILCLYPLLFVVALAVQILVFAAYVRFIQTDSLATALRFGEVLGIVRATPGRWVIVFLVYLLCALVGGLGSIACGIGALFTLVYSQAAFGHVLGQIIVQMGGMGAANQMPPGYGSRMYQ